MTAKVERNSQDYWQSVVKSPTIRNILITFGGQLGSKLLAMVALMIVLRHVSQEEFGSISVAQSVIAVAANIFLQGLNWAMIRGIAAQKGSTERRADIVAGTLWTTLVISFLISGIVFLALMLRGVFLTSDLIEDVGVYVAFGIISTALMNFAVAVMQGKERFTLAALTSISQSLLLMFVYAILALNHALRYGIILIVISVLPLVTFAVFLIGDRSSIRRGHLDLFAMKHVLGGAKMYVIYSSLLAIAGQLDVLMMARYFSFRDVAVYSVASKLFAIVVLGLGAVHSVLLPRLSSIKEVTELRSTFLKSLRYSIPISMFFLLMTLVFPSELIQAFAGADYGEAKGPLQVLGACAALSLVLSPSVNILFSLQRVRLVALGGALVLSIGLAGHIFITSKFGALGAAWSTFLAYAAINGFFFYSALRITSRGVAPTLKQIGGG